MKVNRRIAAATSAALIVLAGCSDTDSSTVAAPPESANFNAADIQFLQAAIPAHEEAIAMGELAEQQTSSASVRLFGSQIVQAQTDERNAMVQLLESWGYSVDAPLTVGSGVPTLTRASDLEALRASAGTAFDAQFLTAMEQHHRRVLAAAQTVETSGESTELRPITDLIIRSQAFEIEQIEQLRAQPGRDDAP
jgi:uncharacterized protein (DUF305 family)